MYPRRSETASSGVRNDVTNFAASRPLPSLGARSGRTTTPSGSYGAVSGRPSRPVKTLDGIHKPSVGTTSTPPSFHPIVPGADFSKNIANIDASRHQKRHMDMIGHATALPVSINLDVKPIPQRPAQELHIEHSAPASPAAPIQQPNSTPPQPVIEHQDITLPEGLDITDQLAEVKPSTASRVIDNTYKGVRMGGLFGGFIGIVIGGAALLNAFIFQSYYVDGLSMQPTLGDDDRLIVSKVERTVAQLAGGEYVPKRGQIVVIDSEASSITQARNEQIIKRIVGLPGDTIEIDNGTVTVYSSDKPDGYDIDKELGLNVPATFSTSPVKVVVPPNTVYVLGDNRAEGGSLDSRVFGPISTDLIKGRLAMRILPLPKAGVF